MVPLTVQTVQVPKVRNQRPTKSMKNNIKMNSSGAGRMDDIISYNELATRGGLTQYHDVQKAYDNLFRIADIAADAPCPTDCGGKDISAVNCTGMTQILRNYANGKSAFKNLFIQGGNPNCPLLGTDPNLNGVTFFPQGSNIPPVSGSGNSNCAELEIYTSNTWGLFRSRRDTGAYTLSVLNSEAIDGYGGANAGYPHKWVFELNQAGADEDQCTLRWVSSNPGASYTVFYRVNYSGAWLSETCVGNGNITFTVSTAAAQLFEMAVYANPENFQPFCLSFWQDTTSGSSIYDQFVRFVHPAGGAGAPIDFEEWVFNLSPVVSTNYVNVVQRASSTKMVRSTIVFTDVIAKMYAGGNCQAGRITANNAPQTSYETLLFSLSGSYLNNLAKGLTSVWWQSDSDLDFRGSHSYAFNRLAMPDTMVNMIIFSNTAVAGQDNNSLPIQVKLDMWIDYAVSDTTIPRVKVIDRTDEWRTIVSMIAELYFFCDNPDHVKVLKFIQDAVKFMASGDPRAVAIRKAAKRIGGAAATAAMALI